MHAYLFVGGEDEEREKKMLSLAQKIGSRTLEFPFQKIEDVRSLAGFTKYSQSEKTCILLKDIDKATTEALNAFLKNLEEPGKNIIYFLSSNNEQSLLPTIASRCQIIRLGHRSKNADPDIVSGFLEMSVGRRLKTFENFRKKDEAKKYLQTLVQNTHAIMIQKGNETDRERKLIKIAQKTIYNLNLNANVNLQMTDFAMNSTKI